MKGQRMLCAFGEPIPANITGLGAEVVFFVDVPIGHVVVGGSAEFAGLIVDGVMWFQGELLGLALFEWGH